MVRHLSYNGQPLSTGCLHTSLRMVTHSPTDGHQLGWLAMFSREVTHLFHTDFPYSPRSSHTFPRMFTNLPHDGHSSFPGWLFTFSRMVNYLIRDRHQAFIKLSPTFPSTTTNLSKDGYPSFQEWSPTFLTILPGHAILGLPCIWLKRTWTYPSKLSASDFSQIVLTLVTRVRPIKVRF